ncbi:MAG: TIGR00266 family protein [Butyrivibrio sp.]|nr:TIGR00266 family protein [Butyrivibrio sp.]
MQYEIQGAPFSVLICKLGAEEAMKCQKGGMAWMSSNMKMQTSGGGLGKMFGKLVTGESMFYNTYVSEGGNGEIAFGMSFPGNIISVDVSQKPIVAQKRAFMACENGVDMSIFFQKKVGSGIFGGEGFIMQKFSGHGMAFLEIDGSTVERELAAGESITVDSGYIAAMEDTCSIDIQMVSGIGNVVFGGEGLFNTVVTGPGKVWLQTMPVPTLANALLPYLPTKTGN